MQPRSARRRRALLGAAALAMSMANPAGAVPYRIDLEHSELVVRVFKAGPAAALAHDHVVRAAAWQGSLDVSRDPLALAADIRVDAARLEVDEPALRSRYGLPDIPAGDRAKTRDAMVGAD